MTTSMTRAAGDAKGRMDATNLHAEQEEGGVRGCAGDCPATGVSNTTSGGHVLCASVLLCTSWASPPSHLPEPRTALDSRSECIPRVPPQNQGLEQKLAPTHSVHAALMPMAAPNCAWLLAVHAPRTAASATMCTKNSACAEKQAQLRSAHMAGGWPEALSSSCEHGRSSAAGWQASRPWYKASKSPL